MAVQDPRLKRPGAFGVGNEPAPVAAPMRGPDLPTLRVQGASPGASGGAGSSPQSLPAMPQVRMPGSRPAQDDGYDSLREFGGRIASGARAVNRGMDKLTTQPPSIAWNMAATRDRMGFPAVAYASSADGQRSLRPTPRGFFRPPSGPGSLPATTVGDVAAPEGQLKVPDITMPRQPLMMPGGAPAAPSFGRVEGSASTNATRLPTSGVAPQPGIDTGTTVEGGRRLSYGAMVDGVPTFSDGSSGIPGVPGSIPRTMSDANISSLGARAQVIPAQVSALASDGMGGVTPTQGQMVDRQMSQIQRPITGSRPSAQDFAAAEQQAIAIKDPRSAAGIAARNLSMGAQYGRTPRARRLAADQLTAFQSGSQQAALTAQQAESASALAEQQGASTLANTQLAGQNTLANTALQQRGELLKGQNGNQVILADGTIGLQDPRTAAITASTMADGSPAKAQITRDDSATKRTNEIMDQLSKGVQEQMKNFMPSKDMPEPTPQMITQWREQNAIAMGLRVGTDPAGRRVMQVNGQVIPL